MKASHYIICMLISAVAAGCNFSIGTKTDLLTGLTIKNKGLSYDNYTLAVDNKKLTSQEIQYGKKIVLTVIGISGFTEVMGKVYPGASLRVNDSSGKEILKFDDLFSQYDTSGVSPVDAGAMNLSLQTGNPMKKDEKYQWSVRIWDKKGAGEINTSMKVILK